MEKVKIGYDAGMVWQVLKENENIKISDLKKITQRDVKDIYMALGWLARENKIEFFKSDKEFAVRLMR